MNHVSILWGKTRTRAAHTGQCYHSYLEQTPSHQRFFVSPLKDFRLESPFDFEPGQGINANFELQSPDSPGEFKDTDYDWWGEGTQTGFIRQNQKSHFHFAQGTTGL